MPPPPQQQHSEPWHKRALDKAGDCADCSDCLDVGSCCDSPCLLTTMTLGVLWNWLVGVFATSAIDPHTAPAATAGGRLAARMVRSYQLHVSIPRGRSVCPMRPTCSRYALQALSRHGLLRGLGLVVGRLRRCRRPGGYDPVPG